MANREVYAEAYVGFNDPHYILYNGGYGEDIANQIGSRNSRGAQAIPEVDNKGVNNGVYLIADNILYFKVVSEKDANAIAPLVEAGIREWDRAHRNG